MPVSTCMNFSGNEALNLSKAILLYMSERNNAYATIHDISIQGGKPHLLAGVPASQEAIAGIARALINNIRIGAFLPGNVLSIGIDSLVWWVPPQSRRVYFRCEEYGGERTAETPHPGLVFRVTGDTWQIFAIKGTSRPEPDTPLYLPPYWNCWSDGRICTGNVSIPGSTIEDSTNGWTDAFFDSYFTHPNVHAPNKLVDYKGGSYKFWQSMLDGKHKKFPEKVLVPMNKTLATLLKDN